MKPPGALENDLFSKKKNLELLNLKYVTFTYAQPISLSLRWYGDIRYFIYITALQIKFKDPCNCFFLIEIRRLSLASNASYALQMDP